MKKFLLLILGSLSLAAGGVVMLYVNQNDITSIEMWKLAFQSVTSIPGYVFEQATSGDQQQFFRGILVTVVGVLLAGFFFAISVLAWVASSIRLPKKSKKSAGWKSGGEAGSREKSKKAEKVKDHKDGQGFGARLSAMKAGFGAKARTKKDVFVDADAALDEEEKPKKDSLLARLMAQITAGKASADTMVIKSGGSDESIITIKEDTTFVRDLKDWYSSIKGVSQTDQNKIKEAKGLVERATKRLRAKVVEEDAMNGEFMLRMMDAWANKKSTSSDSTTVPIIMSEVGETREADGTFSRAIQEVMDTGVSQEEDEDDEFEIGEIDDEDDDFIIQDLDEEGMTTGSANDAVEDDDEDFMLPDDEPTEESASGVDGEGEEAQVIEGELKCLEVVRHILSFEEKVKAVAEFEETWADEFEQEEDRIAYVEEVFGALNATLETEAKHVQELSAFDAEEDAQEIDWLQENVEVLEQKKEQMIQAVRGVSEGADTELSDDDDDLEAEFAIGGAMDAASKQIEESGYEDDFMSSGDDEEYTPDEEDVADIPESAEMQEDVDGGIAEQDENALSDVDATDEVVSEVSEETPTEPAEPRNVSLGELEEIERSDDLIYNWALVVKSAGAAEAKISHSVIAKDGLRRRVVGIAQLIAAWRGREKDESRRLHILLRYVPSGEWSLSMDGYRETGIKMVDSIGDFVQVSAEMIGQPEIEKGTLLVHFYGPGAPEGVLEEKGNVIVTTSTLSVDKVRETMGG